FFYAGLRRHPAPEDGTRCFAVIEDGRVASGVRSRRRLPGHSRQTGGGCRRVEALEGSSRLQEPPGPPGLLRECPPGSACGRRPPPRVRCAGQADPAPRGSGGGNALFRCFAVSLFRCRRRWPVGHDQANAAAYPEETIAFCTASVTLTLPAISWRPLPMATCIGPVGAPLKSQTRPPASRTSRTPAEIGRAHV